MWLLQSDGINWLFHTTQEVMAYISNPMYAKVQYTLRFVPVWQPAPPKPPSERDTPPEKFPEPLSRG